MRRPGPVVTRSFAATARPTPRAAMPPPAMPATSQATPEFRARHDVSAPQVDSDRFRPGWLVESRLDSLFAAGWIDRAQMDGALQWRRWAETLQPSGAQRWDPRVDCSTGPNDAPALWRVKAATKLREVAAAIGPLRVRILEAVVVHDVPWRELARLLRVHADTAKDRAAESIEALTAHLAGEPVPPPPLQRYRNEPGRQ